MVDEIERRDPSASRPGRDLLRELAGEPVRVVELRQQELRYRVLDVHRDALGRVTSSTEHIEELQIRDASAGWFR